MELRTLRYFVAVADERHFGRAAARLHMTQPPLSRAIRTLETEVGAVLLTRSATGVALTPLGQVFLEQARLVLEQADRLSETVAAAAESSTLTVGVLGSSLDAGIARLAAAFRQQHPRVEVRIRETNFADPTCGLRSGAVNVAVTRAPFDTTGLRTQDVRIDAVGAVLRADDPLADRETLMLRDLERRRWFQFPPGTDPLWCSFWNAGEVRSGPVVRGVQECLQAVLWNGTVGMTPLGHDLPPDFAVVPVVDMPPSRLVVAWRSAESEPLVHSFVAATVAAYRRT